ncbi:SAM-dependent methyltransferase [Actinomycetospora soli]|uniref:SAM-dependent methyltransferase n=1 Tax=Actinomycetospora soli TaxID=2893887 RepID=UPI001E421BAC|nr:SAM-dependent methyltransferase [Actinomycetospora soli]MCD2189692.1 SAM-dependent methyltransferase [Actinomycetospora soli]
MRVEYYPAPPPPGPRGSGELSHETGLELDAIVATAADLELPNFARTVDALLGGSANFAVDRDAADALLDLDPLADVRARAQRGFTRRVVRHAQARGIDQFLDLGCGIPSVHSVHDVVLGRDPAARVAYVDLDPVVVAHARDLVADRPTVSVTWGDLRAPACVATAPGVGDHLDLARPVALLVGGALQFVHDDIAAVLAGWRRLLAPGSLLAATHGTTVTRDVVPNLDALYVRGLAGLCLRSPHQVREAFAVVGPAVDVVDWPAAGAGGRAATGVLGAVGLVG